jgi:hypothetical protein
MHHAIQAPANFQPGDNILPDKLESVMGQRRCEVPLVAGKKIVDPNYIMPVSKQPVAQMRSNKTGRTGNKNTQSRFSSSFAIVQDHTALPS